MVTLANIENPAIWVILGVVLLLFGGQKIPEMLKGIGQGMREFKKGMNEKDDDEALRKEREREERINAEVRARMEKAQ